jgi:transcription elongation factor Elf1
MQKGQHLEINCQSCQSPVAFSIFSLDKQGNIIECQDCGKKYAFNDETLLRQLKKFELLCKQIHESEEILGSTSVGIDVGNHHVTIPFKLLLTRLNSSLDLTIGDQQCKIVFRIEPKQDVTPTLLKNK